MSWLRFCEFVERKPNQWFIRIQEGDTMRDIVERGPFPDYESTNKYLFHNFSNPGSVGIQRHPDSKCDHVRLRKGLTTYGKDTWQCNQCGKFFAPPAGTPEAAVITKDTYGGKG